MKQKMETPSKKTPELTTPLTGRQKTLPKQPLPRDPLSSPKRSDRNSRRDFLAEAVRDKMRAGNLALAKAVKFLIGR